jgi:hypothetical protein
MKDEERRRRERIRKGIESETMSLDTRTVGKDWEREGEERKTGQGRRERGDER